MRGVTGYEIASDRVFNHTRMGGTMKKLIPFLTATSLMVAGCQVLAEQDQRKYYGANLCGYEGFTCVKVKGGDTWTKLFPNQQHREIVMRLNRTNIPLAYRSWIVVPDNLDEVGYMDLSPFPPKIDPQEKKLVVVHLGKAAFGAYDTDGELKHWGPISSAKGYCPDIGKECKTLPGKFEVFRKQGASCKSSIFPVKTGGGSPMPYCMHFSRGYALHGSTLPGFHASHGCVRLFNDDAKWLNQEFTDYGTKVIVVE